MPRMAAASRSSASRQAAISSAAQTGGSPRVPRSPRVAVTRTHRIPASRQVSEVPAAAKLSSSGCAKQKRITDIFKARISRECRTVQRRASNRIRSPTALDKRVGSVKKLVGFSSHNRMIQRGLRSSGRIVSRHEVETTRMKSYGARLMVSWMLLAALMLGAPAAARAQNTNEKLAKVLPNLYIEALSADQDVLESLFGPLTPAEFNQLLEGFNAPAAVNVLLGSQVAAFPLGSSAGGFTWTFDPALGTFNRVSPSFGPIFSERALTVGKGRLNLGFNYQRSTFDQLQGLGLRDGEVKAYAGVTRGITTAFFEEVLDLKLSTDTYGLFATYGVTKNLDLGIAVPIVHVNMEARLDFRTTVRIGSSSSTGNLNPGDSV